MGNSLSSSKSTHLENEVFKKELKSLNDIVHNLINIDNKSFRNSSFNLLDKNSCDNYTFVLQNSLNKHLKMDLVAAKDSIFMIPTRDVITTKDIKTQDSKDYTKQDLCSMIAQHYVRILRVLVLIKHVYDLEHSGDNSIAGITWRNIRKQGSLMEISFCNMTQKDYDENASAYISTGKGKGKANVEKQQIETQHQNQNQQNTIDFSKLSGLSYFCEHFLTGVEERKVFVAHLKSLLTKTPSSKIAKYASCRSDIYSGVFKGKCDKKIFDEFNKYIDKQTNSLDLDFVVASGNPILHENMCGQKEKIIVDLNGNGKNKNLKLKLLADYGKLYRNYKKNINDMVDIVMEFVDIDNMQLKSIDINTLIAIEKKVVKVISLFYVQTLVDYYALLETAKQIPDNIIANAEISIV